VQRIRKAVDPPGESRDDWHIICEIATRMGHSMAYDSSQQIMEEISKVTPSYAGISYDRIEYEGIHWPCPTAEHPGTPILHREQFTRGQSADPCGPGPDFGNSRIQGLCGQAFQSSLRSKIY
jgi:predicted molibdopterin-dependent oxidoreductase YjgC